MRLLLDEHFSAVIAHQLVDRFGHDVTAVVDQPGLRRMPDAQLLRAATDEGRALVTENVRDFVVLHRDSMRRREPHAGLVLTTPAAFPRGADPSRIIRALDALFRDNPGQSDLVGLLVWLRPD